MAVPVISYVTAGARLLATYQNSIKDYLDYLLNKPGAQAYRTVAGTIPTGTWSNGIGLDAEDFDRDGMHDPATNNSRMVFQTTGRYRVTARLTFLSNATGYRQLDVWLNSAGTQGAGTFMTRDARAAVNGATTTLECNFTRNFTSGDYIEMFGFQTSGGTLGYDVGIRKVSLETIMEGTN